MNSCHPGPQRVWKGGSEQQFTTSFLVDPADPPDPAAWAKVMPLCDSPRSEEGNCTPVEISSDATRTMQIIESHFDIIRCYLNVVV